MEPFLMAGQKNIAGQVWVTRTPWKTFNTLQKTKYNTSKNSTVAFRDPTLMFPNTWLFTLLLLFRLFSIKPNLGLKLAMVVYADLLI